MEKIKKCCVGCHAFFMTLRNPEQSYCSKSICQNARKQMWRRKKCAVDLDYRANQQRANKSWQEGHPNYWRHYRAAHPHYMTRNREQTRIRQQTARSRQKESPFAKCDALVANIPIKSGLYQLIPENDPLFAKSDALLFKIAYVATG